jgi:stringent starvation protein B
MTDAEVKRIAITHQLQQSDVSILLDARLDGVVVPLKFKQNHALVLELGLNLTVPIPDLDIGESGITATLSFDRTPFWCYIPWPAIYAMLVNNEGGLLFHQSKPADVNIMPTPPAPSEPTNKRSNSFSLVEDDDTEPTAPDNLPAGRPQLKLVD